MTRRVFWDDVEDRKSVYSTPAEIERTRPDRCEYRRYISWWGWSVGSPSVWAVCWPEGPGDPTHAGLVLPGVPADQCVAPHLQVSRPCTSPWIHRNGPTFFWCDEHRETKGVGYFGEERL